MGDGIPPINEAVNLIQEKTLVLEAPKAGQDHR